MQQQAQSEISHLRESLSQVFLEITDGVRKGSEGDHDMKLNFQSLDEQLVQNETRLTQLSESAELSQVQMREFVSELQGQAERVKEELDGLKRFVEETEQRSQERANAISAGVQQLQKDRHVEVERRKDQVQKMHAKAGQVAEQLSPLQSDFQEHRAEGTARQNRVQQGIFALEETRRAEERVDLELKQRIVTVSTALGQTAEHLRQVGESRRVLAAPSPGGRQTSAPSQAARRPSQDAIGQQLQGQMGAMQGMPSQSQMYAQPMMGQGQRFAPVSPTPSAAMAGRR